MLMQSPEDALKKATLSALVGRLGDGSMTRLACENELMYQPQNAVRAGGPGGGDTRGPKGIYTHTGGTAAAGESGLR